MITFFPVNFQMSRSIATVSRFLSIDQPGSDGQ